VEVTKRLKPGRQKATEVVCKVAGRNTSEHRDGPERHDAKADPTWRRGRLARSGRGLDDDGPFRFAGVVGDGMSSRSSGQHGKPAQGIGRLDQRARKASGRRRVAEGLVVPKNPVNAGGGKGPWFQGANGAARDEVDWR
jgi:hypothetical protein